jgi:hypothetical protein
MMDGDDVGMPDAGEHPSFGENALSDRDVRGEPGMRHLHGDPAVQCEIGGLEEHPHPPASKLALEPALGAERRLQGSEEVEPGLARGASRWLAGDLPRLDAIPRQGVALPCRADRLKPH